MSRESLRARLSRLTRGTLETRGPVETRGTVETGEPRALPSAPARRKSDPGDLERVPVGMEELLPGRVASGDHGPFFIHVKRRSEITKDAPGHVLECELAARKAGIVARDGVDESFVAAMDEGLERAVFLDLETAGFAGTTLFLAGTMHLKDGDFELRQYFARDYTEEKGLVAAVLDFLAGFRTLVTFNGKSFDLPFLLDRAAFHRLTPPPMPQTHIDLLHPARRRFGSRLPDCRLQTLEWHLARRRRSGDVPGAEIPDLYHRYVRERDPYPMVGIFHHNLLDLLAMSEILVALLSDDPEESSW